MRRTDREITDIGEIYEIMRKCTSMSLGINGKDFPYVIPMTFGCAMEDGKICVYFHCAAEGTKIDLMSEDNRVCIEAHIYERTEQTSDGEITARYESVVGFGRAIRLDAQADKVSALKIMLEHYKSSGFPVTSCHGLPKVEVYKVVLDEVTGKKNV